MKIEVSNGEIVDKLTIIQIKLERIKEKGKVLNLQKEYEILDAAVKDILSKDNELYKRLYKVNCKLWDIEDRIRELEKAGQFDNEFIETARAVYFTNDERSVIKKEINNLTGSKLVEEKSYEDYK
jgi:peptidoglycan hydrolase CwlO-like protein